MRAFLAEGKELIMFERHLKLKRASHMHIQVSERVNVCRSGAVFFFLGGGREERG